MNISYNWLKDYLKFDLTPEQLSDALTSIGLETGGIETVETIKGGLKGLVIGHVLTCVNHPNSDHLHVTTVDLGTGEPQQIVCGAPNVAAGQKVVVATVGTVLYDGDEPFTIKKSKIRGEESNGMICAEDEIGIGTNHEGIIVLPSDAPVGLPAKDYYKIESDAILEVDITPNRVDAASHYGVARDLAAYLQIQVQGARYKVQGARCKVQDSLHPSPFTFHPSPFTLFRPSVDAFQIDDKSPAVTVEVIDTEACPRYSGVTIKNVKVGESPAWLKNRLESIGVRSINNIVDVTNYVLHETGQPLHAFDVAQIKGGKIVVQTQPDGTSFITLDGAKRTLSDKDLMICSLTEGLCIAGVFGGLDSGVTEKTTDIFLESAYFNPTRIRKTARRHGLNTDASFRYERGADPNNTLYVLKRAALLVKEVAGGAITGDVIDIYPQPINNFVVELSLNKVNSLIGKEIPAETIESILKSLEIRLMGKAGDVWTLNVPTYRVDVTRDVDVIEEILRIYGYNNVEIGEEVKSTLSYKTATDRSHELQNLISEQLTGVGFNEILNNSLTAAAYYENNTAFPSENCVLLKNPLSNDLSVMRQTLLYGGLESIRRNRNHKNPDLKLYELGNTYTYSVIPAKAGIPGNKDANYLASPFTENFMLGLWLTGRSLNANWLHPAEDSSVYELKAYVENVLQRLGLSAQKVFYKPFSDAVFASGLQIENLGGKSLGKLGVLKKTVTKAFDIPVEVFFAELNWNAILKAAKNSTVKQTEIPKFPSVRRDLALLVDKAVTFAEIEKIAVQTDKKLLKEVTLFDVYEGKNLPEGKKSYAVSFILQDEEKTLNDKQIDSLMANIQKNLEQKLGATLR
ncbi:MAG: phenylalanine--tRNA ligase subunit beta [Candidatus Symbiothrix sp.]|jgi:phenylalanyl-tRNA synthetase beta chain|nr:phenylalanine--tRNA ligase subunit beta [Candidatus Symbiothrix sp.]